MNRVISLNIKVKVMEESLCLSIVEETATCYGISVRIVYYWFSDKVKSALGEMLKKDRPGPTGLPRKGLETQISSVHQNSSDVSSLNGWLSLAYPLQYWDFCCFGLSRSLSWIGLAVCPVVFVTLALPVGLGALSRWSACFYLALFQPLF